jgi:acyl-coenzyme A thioesterase PaaI-like protein
MAELAVTGPPALELRWGHRTTEEEGRTVRRFFPERAHHEPRGYLHGGLAAAAFIGAARLSPAPDGPPSRVVVALDEPTPLGVDLRVALDPPGDRDRVLTGTVEHVRDPETESVIIEPTVRGEVVFGERGPAPDRADARQLAVVPVPEAEEHELFPSCLVCGQDNPRGLGLLPGFHAEDRVVSAFTADDRLADGDGHLSPIAAVALLSCPTLWACRSAIEERGAPGALLARYEVAIHELPRVPTVLRSLGWSGQHDDRRLRAESALVDEDGRLYVSANATWVTVDEVPDRDPDGPAPRRSRMPEKGGRPERRSDEDWGEPLPGRREAPGPRSKRPDDT